MKVSVLMITYNHAKYIAQAVSSVLEQRVDFDYEIVVGEDCSTDSTREILKDLTERFPGRIVPLLREKNLGMLRNLIATLDACRGQYVAFLEGDDFWTRQNKLQLQVNFLDRNPDAAICCHRVDLLDDGGKAGLGSNVYPTMVAGSYSIEDLLHSNFIMTCSAVLRRSFVDPLPPWFFKMALGDWPLFAMTARHGSIELLDDIMAAYRVHPAGVWSSRPRRYRLLQTVSMLENLNQHFAGRYSESIRPTLAKAHLDLALIERENQGRTATAKHLGACLYNGLDRSHFRAFSGVAAYVLFGSLYKMFSAAARKPGTKSPRERPD